MKGKNISPGLQKSCSSFSLIKAAAWSYHKNLYPCREKKKKVLFGVIFIRFLNGFYFKRAGLGYMKENQSAA